MFRKAKPAAPPAAEPAPAQPDAESSRRPAAEAIPHIVTTRSRASSIFSTGTKTSINTLPHGPESHSGPIDVLVGRRNFRITARPGSILSISTFDYPAPPYSESTATDGSHSTATEQAAEEPPPSPTETSSTAEHATPVPRRHQRSSLLAGPTDVASLDAIAQTSLSLESDASSRSGSPPSPPLSPLTSSTNAISAHYTSVVRTIDANHRVELERLKEEHAAGLAQTRNDIDAAYRGPFKEARTRGDRLAAEAESLRQLAEERQSEFDALVARLEQSEARVQSLETDLAAAKADGDARVMEVLEQSALANQRARNEVEEFWEGSWRDRMKLSAEESQRAFERGRAMGVEEGIAAGKIEGAERQTYIIKEILDMACQSYSSKAFEGDMQWWKQEILKRLRQPLRETVE